MKKLFAFILFLLPVSAFAVPCSVPPFYDGYSGTFAKYVTYNGYIYGLDEKFLWMTTVTSGANGFVNVPPSVPQSINNKTNGDTFYSTRINHHYPQVLLAEDCMPLLAQTGNYLLAQ